MGISYSSYVGPYIKAYNPLKDSNETHYTCSNEKCLNFKKDMSSEYCPKCGNKICLAERTCETKIDFDVWQISNRLNEVIIEYKPDGFEDFDFFIPIVSNLGLHFDCKYTSVSPIEGAVPGMEINNLKLKFKSEINDIEAVFGKDAVTIEWGVLVWQS